jgi:endonuclease/exonuclease/phosphatase family metal-dependent hydrolase
MHFRLLTYNIHKGIGGVDRRYRPERIVEVVAHYQPDIVCLQEVDEGVKRSQFHQQTEMLAEAWGLPYHCYQRNVAVKNGHYGNAILSRWPLSDACDIDLSVRFKKRRQALLARCHLEHDGHHRTVGVVNVHLGLAGFERKLQLKRLIACDALSHFAARTPLVIAGDYNDVYGDLGRAIMAPAGYTRAGGSPRTFPTAAPVRPLDRVFCRGDLLATHLFAGTLKLARRASDHLPLIVDFEVTS